MMLHEMIQFASCYRDERIYINLTEVMIPPLSAVMIAIIKMNTNIIVIKRKT